MHKIEGVVGTCEMGRVHLRSHAEKIEGGTPVGRREALPGLPHFLASLASLLCSCFCAKGRRYAKKDESKGRVVHTSDGGAQEYDKGKGATRERLTCPQTWVLFDSVGLSIGLSSQQVL